MSKALVLTEKGKAAREELAACDALVRGVTDPETRAVLEHLIDAVEALVASDGPCWELAEVSEVTP